ncbi:MAG: carboxypeptidase-like regulatory domain-containing protein [Pseudomonadota bacterium]|nr:carboxypeptidase-like regulatory domain-containing protein [Pseudomonadota bacterium]
MDIVGTAATGAPLAGAAISLKCAGASFTASAQADGTFRIASVPVDAAPCLLRAQQASTVYVAPVASPGAGTITVNATPLTHLLSSRLLGEPADRAFQNAGSTTFALVNPAGISAARGHVRAQIDRLGITVPGLSSDWITTPFKAQPSDPHDQVLEALGAVLVSHGLTVATAAGQLASNEAVLNLPPEEPASQACTPRLIDGFAGADRTRWVRVGSGPEQTSGIGIGGGPGFTRGASVEVSFANGTRLAGARTDSEKGMVTMVPCGLAAALPALIRMRGEPGSSYYDPGSGRWASFDGRELHGVINGIEADGNLAVTPFTEAVYRRTLALWAEAVAGGGVPDASIQPWQDPGRNEVAHDQVRAVINDQLPGMYQLARLDRMPLLLDQQGDVEGSQALPKTQAGIYGVTIAALARAAAVGRPDDTAPALEITARFAADVADGVLDDPYAGLDASQVDGTQPAYGVGTLWQRMTIGAIAIGRRVGVPALWPDKPFPLALVNPSNYRSMVGADQYTGLYSDGMLRVVNLAGAGPVTGCWTWCNPVRRVPTSDNRAWWVYEIGRMTDFDPDSRIGRLLDGTMVSVGAIFEGLPEDDLLHPVDVDAREFLPDVRLRDMAAVAYRGHDGRVLYQHPSGIRELAGARELDSLAGMYYGPATSFVELTITDPDGPSPRVTSQDPASGLHLFGIDRAGKVQRLVYGLESSDGWATSPVLQRRTEMPLPGRARQLTSDGRLVYALLSDGYVYVLNPEVIVAEGGSFAIDGLHQEYARHFYRGGFRSAGYPANVPLRVEGIPRVCRIGGTYLQACDGRLLVIDRVYHWNMTSMSHDSIRAPGSDYDVRHASGLDAKGWRASKAPLSVDLAWDPAVLRLLSRVDGSYELQSDTHGIRDGNEWAGLPRRISLPGSLVESWLGN